MSDFDVFENENSNARRSVLGASSKSQSVLNSREFVFDSNSNDREATQLPESDIERRSRRNKETWRYVLSVFDPIKGLPDRKLPRKHLDGNSKPCYRRKLFKKSNFRKLDHVFLSSKKCSGIQSPKILEEVRSKNIQPKNSKTIDEKESRNAWLSSKKVSKDGVKLSRDICTSLSSSQVKAISVPTEMEVETFGSKDMIHNNYISANQKKSEIILNHEIKDFDDSVKSKSWMQTISSSENVKLVANSSNLMKARCGKQNDTPNLRIVSKLDGYSGTSKGVLFRNKVDPKCLTLRTDRQRHDFNTNLANCCPSTSKLIANTNANEDYNIVWSSSDSEDGSKSSTVITNGNANEDYNIIWSSSDSEDKAWSNKSYQTKEKSKYAGSNTELNLLIQAIEKDRRRSNAIREKYASKKGGYSEKFKKIVVKAKMDFGFLSYEQSTGILQGMFAVVTKVEKSYGVCTANLKVENDNSCCFFLERRVESVNDGDKLVSFVNSSRFYTVNDINIFIQPNKVVCA